MNPNKVKCVIFDCDGVLVDSEIIGIRVLLELASAYGVVMEEQEAVRRLSGRNLTEAVATLQSLTNLPFAADFIEQYRTRSYALFEKEVKPVEGIREVLEQITVPFCVASSGPVKKIELNLRLTGLLPFFEGNIFSAYTINSWKPDPGIFLHAAATMGFNPADCVVVEDSLAGIQAAKAGGFRALGYASEHSAAYLAAAGAEVFYQMKQLPALL
ncbi:HAD family hydrolase [Chitinophaga qingshengii]|uniref:HAD family hydrolase n=1 Tax=Chitinophaga qingshengii TaxID=1569794 RepID=A0ABR7TW51_9BACT|nr:HAD family hydrolase [Chitinophaga qingshengii]MBC9934716.1 HAD family hydrolase [Chitinophaga qingshengii]